MNGNIWVNNNENGPGATFSFYLAVHESFKPVQPNKLVAQRHPVSPTMVTQSKTFFPSRVLVVDDTIINLKVLERMLLRLGVGKVTCASSGKAGLAEMERDHFDLILTDLQMPEMDGIEFTKIILEEARKNHRTPPIIVGVTAGVSNSTEQRCLEAGMVRVLHKPITCSQMQDFFEVATFSPIATNPDHERFVVVSAVSTA